MILLSSAWRASRRSSGLSSANPAWVKVERVGIWMCVTYGVEHETAVSVESDLPFVLMGFVLFVVILGRPVYVTVKVKVKEPRPKTKFKKRVGDDRIKTRAKYMRVHCRNRPAQDSVTEEHPIRAETGH